MNNYDLWKWAAGKRTEKDKNETYSAKNWWYVLLMLGVFVVSIVLMEHIVDIELQYISDNVLDIQRGETDTHIVEQQEHGSVGIEFLDSFHELVLHIFRERYLSRFDTVQMFTADTSHDCKPCLGHAVR